MTQLDADAGPADADYQRSAKAASEAIRRKYPEADPLSRLPDVHPDAIPRHIAVIMDGNGRWAEQRGFPRQFGHRNGAAAVRTLIGECGRLGIEALTLYSFSSENWKRPREEVEALMDLCVAYCLGEREELVRQGVRFRAIGRREGLPGPVRAAVDALERATDACCGPTLCVALNYGARAEITDAVRAIARAVRAGAIDPEAIDEATIEANLSTAGLPDPDLLIRTGGEMRLSNYLLWQLSYAEIYVTDVLWPEFREADLHAAVRAFVVRRRRFGGVEAVASKP